MGASGIDVAHGNIWKRVLLYVLPLMAASLFQQLYTVVDAFIVGNFVSAGALGAIDSTTSVVRLLVNFFVGISTGASIVVAQLWGAGREREVGSAVHAAFLFSLACGVFVTVLGLVLSGPLLRLLNTPAENWDSAYTFIMIYFCGMGPLMVYNMCAAILRAVGDARRPLYFIAASTVVNIALDVLFVPVLGWGVPGAAWATVISEVVSCVLAVAALARDRRPCRLVLRSRKLDVRMLKRMVLLGLPTGVGSALYPVSNTTVQWGVNSLGATVVTGWALTGKVDLLVWLILDSFGVAATTFVAQCYGAGLPERARKSVLVCIVLSAAMLVPLCTALYFWGVYVAGLFADDAAALEVCGAVFRFLAPWYTTFVIVEVLSGAIRGAGETVGPMVITLLGTCVLRIVWMFLVVPSHLEVLWVAAVYPISWVVTDCAFVAYWFLGRWRTRLYPSD
jgi:putative MATE family efflux protein